MGTYRRLSSPAYELREHYEVVVVGVRPLQHRKELWSGEYPDTAPEVLGECRPMDPRGTSDPHRLFLTRERGQWQVRYQLLDTGRERFDAPPSLMRADLVVLAAGSLGRRDPNAVRGKWALGV